MEPKFGHSSWWAGSFKGFFFLWDLLPQRKGKSLKNAEILPSRQNKKWRSAESLKRQKEKSKWGMSGTCGHQYVSYILLWHLLVELETIKYCPGLFGYSFARFLLFVNSCWKAQTWSGSSARTKDVPMASKMSRLYISRWSLSPYFTKQERLCSWSRFWLTPWGFGSWHFGGHTNFL